LFLNVTGSHIKEFVVDHHGKRLLVDVDITPDGGNITVVTEDDTWTLDTKVWLVHDDGFVSGAGLVQPDEPFTYLIHHP